MLMNNIGEPIHKQVIDTGVLPILVKMVKKKVGIVLFLSLSSQLIIDITLFFPTLFSQSFLYGKRSFCY